MTGESVCAKNRRTHPSYHHQLVWSSAGSKAGAGEPTEPVRDGATHSSRDFLARSLASPARIFPPHPAAPRNNATSQPTNPSQATSASQRRPRSRGRHHHPPASPPRHGGPPPQPPAPTGQTPPSLTYPPPPPPPSAPTSLLLLSSPPLASASASASQEGEPYSAPDSPGAGGRTPVARLGGETRIPLRAAASVSHLPSALGGTPPHGPVASDISLSAHRPAER